MTNMIQVCGCSWVRVSIINTHPEYCSRVQGSGFRVQGSGRRVQGANLGEGVEDVGNSLRVVPVRLARGRRVPHVCTSLDGTLG